MRTSRKQQRLNGGQNNLPLYQNNTSTTEKMFNTKKVTKTQEPVPTKVEDVDLMAMLADQMLTGEAALRNELAKLQGSNDEIYQQLAALGVQCKETGNREEAEKVQTKLETIEYYKKQYPDVLFVTDNALQAILREATRTTGYKEEFLARPAKEYISSIPQDAAKKIVEFRVKAGDLDVCPHEYRKVLNSIREDSPEEFAPAVATTTTSWHMTPSIGYSGYDYETTSFISTHGSNTWNRSSYTKSHHEFSKYLEAKGWTEDTLVPIQNAYIAAPSNAFNIKDWCGDPVLLQKVQGGALVVADWK